MIHFIATVLSAGKFAAIIQKDNEQNKEQCQSQNRILQKLRSLRGILQKRRIADFRKTK